MATEKYLWTEPHPGTGGAAVPMPKAAKAIADKLTGKKTTSQHALDQFKKLGKDFEIKLSEDDNDDSRCSLLLQFGNFGKSGPVHIWRVVKGTKV